MTDRKADDVRLDIFERTQMPVPSEQGDARSARDRFGAARYAERRREVAAPARKPRLDGDVREMFGGKRAFIALQPGAEQHSGELPDVAGPAVAHQHRERVIANGKRAHARLLAETGQQVADKCRDIAAALA